LAQQIAWLAERIVGANHVACMTGAGVSAESGVPTFRGAGGLWEGLRAEEVATPEAFARDPELVWRFYLARRRGLIGIQPNPAHLALVELERICRHFELITQNVDGLHHLAGSRKLITLHGEIWIDRCTHCGQEERVSEVAEGMPKCPHCGGLRRPGVVWFGEVLPPDAMQRAAQAARSAELFLVIGTSSVVQPAASLAHLAKDHGATVIEINTEPTPLTQHANATLAGRAGEIMARVMAAVASARRQ
jgi:NAD-dependent deacetylase